MAVTRRDALQQLTGGGSMIMILALFLTGGVQATGSSEIGERILLLEDDVTQTKIDVASLVQNVKHNENLMEKQYEKYEKIYDLLLQLCQGMAVTNGQRCTT